MFSLKVLVPNYFENEFIKPEDMVTFPTNLLKNKKTCLHYLLYVKRFQVLKFFPIRFHKFLLNYTYFAHVTSYT